MKKSSMKKILLVVLSICMVLAVFPVSFAQTAETAAETVEESILETTQETQAEPVAEEQPVVQPMGIPVIPEYTGTADTPHPINNKYELASIGNAEFGRAYPLGGNYIQTQDIVFTEEDFQPGGDFYNDGKGWKPIGIDPTFFSGTYDGGRHVISNIYINRPDGWNISIFGSGNNTTEIRNLGNVNGTIIGKTQVTGIIGINPLIVDNCYNESTIYATDGTACGITSGINSSSKAKGGRITNCHNKGMVEGEFSYGIVHHVLLTDQKIEKCYNSGEITGFKYAAGISETANGKINNCYNTGKITASKSSGIVNESLHLDGSEINNCFNSGEIIGIDSNSLSLSAGISTRAQKVSNCFNYGTITGYNAVGGIVGMHSNRNSLIINCYNRATVNHAGGLYYNDCGGIVGTDFTINGYLKNSYNASTISGSSSNTKSNIVGGMYSRSYASYADSLFYDEQTSSYPYAHAEFTTGSLTTSQMIGLSALSNMPGLNDDDAFEAYAYGYPELKVFKYSDDPFVREMSRRSVHVGGVPIEEVVVNNTAIGTDNNQIAYTGNWNRTYPKAGCYEEDDHTSNQVGAYFEVPFEGTQIKWYGIKANTCGMADVYIDDVLVATVDAYSPTRLTQELIFDSGELELGQHTLKVVVSGNRHPSASSAYISLDKLEIQSVL